MYAGALRVGGQVVLSSSGCAAGRARRSHRSARAPRQGRWLPSLVSRVTGRLATERGLPLECSPHPHDDEADHGGRLDYGHHAGGIVAPYLSSVRRGADPRLAGAHPAELHESSRVCRLHPACSAWSAPPIGRGRPCPPGSTHVARDRLVDYQRRPITGSRRARGVLRARRGPSRRSGERPQRASFAHPSSCRVGAPSTDHRASRTSTTAGTVSASSKVNAPRAVLDSGHREHAWTSTR